MKTPDLTVGFDLDLTLVDSRPAILEAFAVLAEQTGTALDLGEIAARQATGVKLEDELRNWYGEADIESTAELYRTHYRRLAATGTLALPGAASALAAVREALGAVLVVTAKQGVSAELCLTHCGLRADVMRAHLFGMEKAEALREHRAVLYVGDTPSDMRAARAANSFAVGVTTGGTSEAELREAGANEVFSSLEQFPLFFQRWRRELPGRSS